MRDTLPARTKFGRPTKRHYHQTQRIGSFLVRHYCPVEDSILRARLIEREARNGRPWEMKAHEISYHVAEAPAVETWLASGAADRVFFDDYDNDHQPCPVPLFWGDDPHYQWTDFADRHHAARERARQDADAERFFRTMRRTLGLPAEGAQP